ncbi:hypothetical protein BSZ19_18560 [Bradyrhizobium japonicum]|uniref:Uncharacterized protein n=1 Tax=Bradyrhizobium japonicum TaxID=375 RepID=A0A1Y2JNZ0_BRAJP|nr:hypothetical protein [Bradyrhizobium japonicum]OSJ32554.1 hypothetical protein BSZ19_18560 [Bradyrhizobium japonicum]
MAPEQRVFSVYASKGMDSKKWQQSCYRHEAATVEELRAWVEKKARNMARGYRREHGYHQVLKKSEAEHRARLTTNAST